MTNNSSELLRLIESMLCVDYRVTDGPLTPENVYASITEKTLVLRGLIEQSNALLDGWLAPLLAEPRLISRDTAEDLYELAQAFFQPPKHIDTQLALTIYNALIEYARAANDCDWLIKCLYWRGLSLFYLGSAYYRDEMLAAFSEAASYRSRYKEFSDSATRNYINRSIGNVFVAINTTRFKDGIEAALAAMDEAMAFWTDPDIRAFDPDMSWDLFVYSIHQNTCVMLDLLRGEGTTAYVGDKALAKRVYESAVYMTQRHDELYNTKAAHTISRLQYTMISAKYHMGLTTARETGEALLSMCNSVSAGDYSLDATYRKIQLSCLALHYLGDDPDYDRAALSKLKEEVLTSVAAYIAQLPRDISQFTVNTWIAAFVDSTLSITDSKLFIDTVLRLTTYRHMPTYVHSLMVSWLAELICGYMCDNNPSFLIGVADTTCADDVRNKRGEIVDLAQMAGLCHDVGKITYINTVSIYSRKLSDNEFKVITSHPDKGYQLLRNSEYSGIADVARGHHQWHDGSRGYPAVTERSVYKPVTDIITVCDSIEAATDTLGRPYARGKNAREVVAEIQREAGTRYSPEVAEALKDEALVAAVDEIITAKRVEAYFTAYMRVYS